MGTVALYPLSGDVLHFGHIDIGERASKMFDKVYVAIGINEDKKALFSLSERVEMARKSFIHLKNVEVVYYNGLTVNLCAHLGASIIVRGSRNEKDFSYEQQMFYTNRELSFYDIDVIVLPSKKEFINISSSMVKEIAKFHGDITPYVPLHVKQSLEKNLHGQYFLCVTGEPGVGKNYICDEINKVARNLGIKTYHIDVDFITIGIYTAFTGKIFEETREKILETFGRDLKLNTYRDNDNFIDRSALSKRVLGHKDNCELLISIMKSATMYRIQELINDKRGLILINSALIAEAKISHNFNNNVLFIICRKELQMDRLKNRGYSIKDTNKYLNSQYAISKKITILQNTIDKDGYGDTWCLENDTYRERDEYPIETSIREIIKTITSA